LREFPPDAKAAVVMTDGDKKLILRQALLSKSALTLALLIKCS
jgi:hypothetical protein